MLDLERTLVSVRDRIEKWRGQAIGEENTKTVLIEPILRALGWDLEDLDEVRKEFRYKPGDNPVDYAMFLFRTPRLYLEAKALGENLADRRLAFQIMGYAGVAGVKWIVLTDGNEYLIYNADATGDMEKRLFRRVSISPGDPFVRSTLGLLSKDQLQEKQIEVLWQADHVDRQVKAAIAPLFAPDIPADFLHLIRKRTPDLSVADVRASLARARFALDYPLLLPPEPQQPGRGRGRRPPTSDDRAATNDAGHEGEPPIDKTPWRHVTLAQLTEAGVLRLPLEISCQYRGNDLTARIEAADRIVFAGTAHDSLSTAGGMARKSVIGETAGRSYPQTNGWTFWEFQAADGSRRRLDVLRRQLYESKVVKLEGRRVG